MRKIRVTAELIPAEEGVPLAFGRMVATPEKQLKVLLQRMKILIPNRPKVIENVVQKMG